MPPPPLPGSALDLIVDALVELGALAEEETPTAAQAQLGLRRLNQLVDGWIAEPLTLPAATRAVYPLVAGQQAYTIGPGGQFDQARPAWLEAAGVLVPSGPDAVETPIEILTEQRWQAVALKTLVTGIPAAVYPDRGYPLVTLTFYGAPSAGLGVALYAPVAFTGFENLSTVYRFRPALSEALLYNLAVRLSEPFTRPVSAHVARMAAKTLARLKRLAAPRRELAIDPALRQGTGRSDIRTGEV